MKKIIPILFCLFAGTNAFAQQEDTLLISHDGNKIELKALGFDISLSPKKNKDKGSDSAFSLDFLTSFQFGWIAPFRVDYSMYNAATEPYGDFMSTNILKSVYLSLDIVDFNVRIFPDTYLGFGIRNDRLEYVFANRLTLEAKDGKIAPRSLGDVTDFRKSKLVGRYIGIPVHLQFRPNDFIINLEHSFSILENSFTKYRNPNNKSFAVPYMNKWQMASAVSVTYNDFGFYVRYYWTPLFEEGKGPQFNTLSAGFRCDF